MISAMTVQPEAQVDLVRMSEVNCSQRLRLARWLRRLITPSLLGRNRGLQFSLGCCNPAMLLNAMQGDPAVPGSPGWKFHIDYVHWQPKSRSPIMATTSTGKQNWAPAALPVLV